MKSINIQKLVLNLVVVILLLAPIKQLNAQTVNGFKWQQGEELSYGVFYSFFRLGTITLYNLGKETINNIESNHIRVTIESNPLLFWLDHKSVYDSYVTDKVEGVRFVSDEKIDGREYNATYDYDYDAKRINLTLFDKKQPNKIEKKTIKLVPRLIDGISLIYFARVNSMVTGKDSVSTFIEDKSGKVQFNFLNEKAETKVDSLPSEINTVYFNGKMFIKGVGGVTGPFESWFSDDHSRVPILSHMEVFIGHVSIELEKWKNWSPRYR